MSFMRLVSVKTNYILVLFTELYAHFKTNKNQRFIEEFTCIPPAPRIECAALIRRYC